MNLRACLTLRGSLLGVLSLILSGGCAFACFCAPSPYPLDALTNADFVFKGRVTSSENGLLRVAVDETYKGRLAPEVRMRAGGGTCLMLIPANTPYLIYAYKLSSDEEVIWTGPCTRTKPVAQAQEDLLFLDARRDGRVRIRSISRLSPQALEITWTSRAATDYRIESSADLQQWSEVAVVRAASSQTAYTDERDLPPALYGRIVELATDP